MILSMPVCYSVLYVAESIQEAVIDVSFVAPYGVVGVDCQ